MLDYLIAFFILLGGGFMLIGSIGLARLPDFYMRLHGPTKATTLGIGSLLIASMLYFSRAEGTFSVHELLVTIFLFISAPVSAQMLAKAALHARVQAQAATQGQTCQEAAREQKNIEQNKAG
ncbi:Na+/H+ antiporter subunit G [Marinospirillum sp.]|uniref:Na+/H+ antiporter subunit G n=1 Tax=Marinospirillum sp. TaxID=2183934 RepID=UPI003A88B12F